MISRDEAAAIVAEYEAAGSVRAAAEAAGVPKSTFHGRLVAARAVENTPDGFATAGVSTIVDGDGEPRSHAVRARRGASRKYEEPEGHKLARLSSLIDADGRVIQEWRITTPQAQTISDLAAALREELADANRIAPTRAPERSADNLLTVYPVVDQHHGLYAWAPETGDDFDAKISEETFRAQLSRLVSLSPPSRVAQILGLGDFLHTDGHDAVTVASRNQLDRDGRQSRVVRTGFRLLRWAVETALEKHAEVNVTVRAGNHDPMSAIFLAHMLDIAFEREPRVHVDLDPSLFWFARFGNVLLAATHGHTVKPADFAAVMAAECGQAWGETEFRYGFQGHIHHETRIEKGGATVETFQTLAAKDAWHAGRGYSAGRSMTAITFDRELGEVSRIKSPVKRASRGDRVIQL